MTEQTQEAQKKEGRLSKTYHVRLPKFLRKLLAVAVVLVALYLGVMWAGHSIVILPAQEFDASFLR